MASPRLGTRLTPFLKLKTLNVKRLTRTVSLSSWVHQLERLTHIQDGPISVTFHRLKQFKEEMDATHE